MDFHCSVLMIKTLLWFLAIGTISSSTSTNDIDTPSITNSNHTSNLNVSSQLLSEANNKFSVKLYNELIETGENLITSPFSVATLLAMVLLGAKNQTASEISETLGYGQFPIAHIEQAYKQSLTMIRASTECELSIANSIWLRDSFPVLQSYKDRIASSFDAEECDFNQDNGLSEINNWASRKTKNKIQNLLDEVPTEIVMLLLNAVYFKGPWKFQFDKELNENGLFRNNDVDDFRQTTFMVKEQNYGYKKSRQLKAKLLDLPYTDENMSMIFILPGGNYTLADTEAAIKNKTDVLLNAIDGLQEQKVKVRLPKLSISKGFDLVAALQRLGVQKVFTESADLSGINPLVKLSKVFQKGTVDINEEGAEATVSTAFLFSARSLFVPQTKIFNANHPFMFLLFHKPTKTILFMGRFTKV